jgi:hypothetical protein
MTVGIVDVILGSDGHKASVFEQLWDGIALMRNSVVLATAWGLSCKEISKVGIPYWRLSSYDLKH